MCYEIGYWHKYTNSLYEYFDATLLPRPPPPKKGGGGIGVANITDNHIMVAWFIKASMDVFRSGRQDKIFWICDFTTYMHYILSKPYK